MARREEGADPQSRVGGITEEQRSQRAVCAKTLRAVPHAGLARASRTTAGPLSPPRLASTKNPSPQDPSLFSDRLLAVSRLTESHAKIAKPAKKEAELLIHGAGPTHCLVSGSWSSEAP